MQLLDRLETYVRVGDIVQWYPQGDRSLDSHAAVVVLVGMEACVDLHIMEPKMSGRIAIDGARHINDTSTRSEERLESGCWVHKPETIASRLMLLQHEFLTWEDIGSETVLEFTPYANARAKKKKAEAEAKAKPIAG